MLLGTGIGTTVNLTEDFRKLNVPLNPAIPVMLVLGSLVYAAPGNSYASRQEAALAAKLLGDTYFHEKTRCVGIVDRYGDLLWMIQPTSESAIAGDSFEGAVRFLEGTLELISGACLESLSMESAFTICSTPFAWEELPRAYDRLRQMQHHRAGDGTSMVMTVQAEPLDMTGQTRDGLRTEKLEPLSGLLEAGRRDEFIALLSDLSTAVGDPAVEAIQVMELYYSISLMLLSYVNRRQLSDRISAIELMRFEGHASWQEAFLSLTRTAVQLFSLRRTYENSRAKAVIEEICSYVEDHIAEDLSIVRLAGRFHFNPAYLSRLFKQGSGQNLSDYIEEARVRNAKKLLVAGELRVHEVGARVGYESPHSFTRFFKKATGMTPQEYREFKREA